MAIYTKCFGTIGEGEIYCKDLSSYFGMQLYTYYRQEVKDLMDEKILHIVSFAVVPHGVYLTPDNINEYKVRDLIGLAILATCSLYKVIEL